MYQSRGSVMGYIELMLYTPRYEDVSRRMIWQNQLQFTTGFSWQGDTTLAALGSVQLLDLHLSLVE